MQKLAAEFRATHGFSPNEPLIVENWVRKLKVLTVFKPMHYEISGMALKQENNRFILINSEHQKGRQHFTVAHEFYHLFVQDDFSSMVCSTGTFNKKNTVEFAADWFATHLLLPEEGVIALIPDDQLDLGKITLDTILRIEHHFHCSRAALVKRLEQLKFVDSKTNHGFNNKIMQRAIQHGYETGLYNKANANVVIGDYAEKALNLFKTGKISEGHYLSFMNDIGLQVDNLIDAGGEEE
jgi:Zn-dependent peptidase ImmA (M78 family)